jgi:hypothetical protein
MSESVEDGETNVTEITIQPDGRVYVFGLSRPIAELLAALQPGDARLQKLIERTDHAPAADADDPPR